MQRSVIILFFVSMPILSKGIGDDIALLSFYKNIIETLADDGMQGRAVCTSFETKAAEYIQQQFSHTAIAAPVIQNFEFLHPDTKKLSASKNVYCYVNNKAGKTILIGAHYDHIGLGESRSLSFNKKGQVHNGADDNASGVALMIGLMHQYNKWSSKKYNYIFVAYSAHEIGLYGSKHFKNYITSRIAPLALVINFDMVGRLDLREKILAVYGHNSIAATTQFFMQKTDSLKIRTDENDMIYQTDASIFASSDIPSLSFTTGTHDDYHKVSDDAQYINYQGIIQIQHLMETFLKTISI